MTTKERAKFNLDLLLNSTVGAKEKRRGDRLQWFGFISKPFDHDCVAVSYKTEEEALNAATYSYDWFKKQFEGIVNSEAE